MLDKIMNICSFLDLAEMNQKGFTSTSEYIKQTIDLSVKDSVV